MAEKTKSPGKKKKAPGVRSKKKSPKKRLSKAKQRKRSTAKKDEEKALAEYGRPREYLKRKDIKNIELLASRCVKEADIATIVGIGLTSLRDHFQAPIKKGRANMRASLLAVTFAAAMRGNVTAQIWLSKQEAVGLNFTDKLRTEAVGEKGGPIQFETMNAAGLWGILNEAASQGRLTDDQKRRIGWTSNPS